MIKKVFIGCIAILLAIPLMNGVADENLKISLLYTPPNTSFEKIFYDGNEYTIIHIDGCGITAEVGKPQLPAKRFILAIPYGENANVIIKKMNYSVIKNITIYPFQKPIREGENTELVSEFIINTTFYSTDIFYPENVIEIKDAKYYGMNIAFVTIYPVQFNPLRKEVKLYNEIKFEIETGAGEKKEIKFMKDCERIVYNVEDMHRFYYENYAKKIDKRIACKNLTDVNNSADYLIITHDNFYNAITPLAKWKQMRGYETKVVNVSDVYSQFPGSGSSAIKYFISYAYHNWSASPSYVLLVGDVEFIPTFSGLGGCATDLPYSMMDGNDYFPDIKLGRISVKNESELDVIVDKIIGYEKNPYMNEIAWYKNATVFYGTERPPWQQTANFIENLLTGYRYNVSKWNEYEGGTDRMASEINAGRCFVSYREHGSVDGWYMAGNGGFYNDDVMALVNGRKLPVIFSTTCNTGWFDYSGMDCFGEVWMKKQNGGAIAFLGSSRPSYTGYNDELAKGFYKAMFNDSIYDFVGIMNQGKLYMYNYYGDGYYTELEYQMYNSFTEPSLWIYTDVPHFMSVTYPKIIPIGEFTLTINVKDDNGNSIEGATVVIKKDGEFFYRNITDENGNATFSLFTSTIGNISFVVTAHNFVPYIDNISVIGRFYFNLSYGWNFVTIACENNYTASSLYNDIQGCNLILKWNNSKNDFDVYTHGSPNNFAIENGTGYFISVSNNTNLSVTGLPIQSVNITLLVGWNSLGWFKEEQTNASDIYNSIAYCNIILKWNNSRDDFDVYVPGAPDFVIEQGNGFFVSVSQQSQWHG